MSETKETFGVGFRPQHYNWVTTHRPAEVDVFEIVSENFMGVGGRPRFFLEKLRADYPLLMHGVSLSIGSKGPFDMLYLKKLKELTHIIQPQMISDHLSWGRLSERNSHDLLPIVYSKANLDEIAAKVSYLQDYLGQKFYLENPSAYVAFQGSEYDEAGFFAELLQRTGAGILLDLNNLFVNFKNLGQDPEHFLRALRPESVGYFHLAGHSVQNEVLIDTHDQPVPDSVWSIYKKAREFFPGIPSVVEWDGNIPEFEVLLAESEKARSFARGLEPKFAALPKIETPSITIRPVSESGVYEQFFDEIVRTFRMSEDGTKNLRQDLPVSAHIGLTVYNHAFFLRLEELMMDIYPGLAIVCEEEGFRYLLTQYLDFHPPIGSSLKDVASSFPTFLKENDAIDYDFGVPLKLLGDLASLEHARSEAYVAEDSASTLSPKVLSEFTPALWETTKFHTTQNARLVTCDFAVLPTLLELDKKEVSAPPEEILSHYLIYRHNYATEEVVLDDREAKLLEAFASGATLMSACDAVNEKGIGYYDNETISYVASKIMHWAGQGLISA
ncbi:MAG: DUF692 family protein [Proteobacteria bacterium]|nr:MAG: DUF692 family protein [Pseudomonadota bacterium]